MKLRKFAVALGIVAAGLALGCTPSQAQTPGTLDTTFGSKGIVTTSLGSGVNGNPIGAFEQSNGDILVVVSAGETTTPFGSAVEILRYTPEGVLDTTFGTNGILTTTIPNIFVLASVAQDAEGRFVFFGKAAPNSTSSAEGIGVARLTANGQLDSTFGTGGVVTTFFPVNLESLGGFLVQPNGQVVAGASEISTARRVPGTDVLVRYNSNGTLDSSFGTAGIATVGSTPSPLALLANGDYLGVNGTSTVEFSPTGAALSTFTFSTPTAASTSGSIAIQINGDLLEATSVLPPGTPPSRGGHPPSDVQVSRFTENGEADSTFTTTIFPFVAITSANSLNVNENGPSGVGFESNGQIIVSGEVSGSASGSVAMVALARLNADGGLDSTFGTGGAVTNASLILPQAMLIQTNGNIVVVGVPAGSASEVEPSIVLERFLNN